MKSIRIDGIPSREELLNHILQHAWLKEMSLFQGGPGHNNATATFASAEDAERVYDALQGIEIRGSNIRMTRTDDRGPGRSVCCSYDPEEIQVPLNEKMGFLTVDSLNGVGLEQAYDHFSTFGPVVGVLIIDCGWTAWVIFREEEDARRVIQGGPAIAIGGRIMHCNIKKNPLSADGASNAKSTVQKAATIGAFKKKKNRFNHRGDPWFDCFEKIFGCTVDAFIPDVTDDAKYAILAHIYEHLPYGLRPEPTAKLL